MRYTSCMEEGRLLRPYWLYTTYRSHQYGVLPCSYENMWTVCALQNRMKGKDEIRRCRKLTLLRGRGLNVSDRRRGRGWRPSIPMKSFVEYYMMFFDAIRCYILCKFLPAFSFKQYITTLRILGIKMFCRSTKRFKSQPFTTIWLLVTSD